MKQVWKEASSVIISAKAKSFFKGISGHHTNLLILGLKRHSDSPILPNFYVFPGGHTHQSDSSEEWRKVFSQSRCKIARNGFEKLNQNVTLPIFQNTKGDGLPKAISLRISAIRETFEESGILLCKRFEENTHELHEHLEIESIDEWRQRVIADANNFIELCLENKCYPNVMALNLWSNWMTPVNVPFKKFNAVFFLVVLEDCYRAIPDFKEIEEIGWYPPDEWLKKNDEGQISLSTPQFYELSRLLHFKSAEELSKFAVQLNHSDCELMLPVVCFLDDQTISLFPGDELYPANAKEFTLEDTEPFKQKLEQSHKRHRLLHSHNDFELRSLIVKNVIPKCANILPSSSYHKKTKIVPKNKL